jgi:hypothetical protein
MRNNGAVMPSRKPLSRYLVFIYAFFLAINLPHPSSAQEDEAPATRDPQSLAERFLGYDGAPTTSPLTPIYNVDDTAEFWVGKTTSETPVRISATLVAASPGVYLWVEDGIATQGNLSQRAGQLSQILTLYRMHDNYREAGIVPGIGEVTDPNDLLAIPDIDNDPHLYILFTTNLSEEREAIFNPLDSLPVEFAPFSNQHEMLYVNTSPYGGTLLSDALYTSMLVRAIYRFVIAANVDQPAWLTEALDWSLLFAIQETQVPAGNLTAFLQAPDTPLLQPPTLTTQSQVIGGQQLFLGYFQQRYGSAPLTDLYLQPGSGISPLDAVLEARNIIDPATGALVTGRDAFADFVLTNTLNFPFGDGRYVQGIVQLPEGQLSTSTALTLPAELSGLSVNQFGAQIYTYSTSQERTVEVTFDGSPTVARLPMPIDHDPADPYYWSEQGGDQNPTLTRALDLSDIDSATLTFDTWYNLVPGWNYGYVSVSANDGETWQPLQVTNSSANNLYGVSYGAGFSGISTTAQPRPFPILGVVVGSDGVTANDVSAGGPAATAGVRAGDVIIGYDNHEWIGTPNLLGLLANYAPGDTLHLYIQRGSDRLDIPVVLGAHPTRVVEPSPTWLPQTADLTPYAGQQILLRFETVTLPGREDRGFAVDNLAIPEIDWTDTAETTDDWTLNGWTQVDNVLPQQWIVQAATSGLLSTTQTIFPRVRRLLDAGDDSSTGSWRFALGAGETLVLTVSGVNDDTTERATFSLGVKSE